MRTSSTSTTLALVLLTACGGDDASSGDGGTAGSTPTLEFRGSQAFLPALDLDTGWLPEGSPAAVRATMTADGELAVVASATTDGTTMEGVPGSGELSVGGTLPPCDPDGTCPPGATGSVSAPAP